MNDTRMVIALGNMEFTLIGTAHVSKESINEVSGIIREEKPDLICVELDEGRYASLTQKDNWESLDMVKVFKEGKGFLLMANLVLSGFQRRMGAELGVKPGEEMKVALETAKELGIPHALCDREIQLTLRRAWAGCGLWSKSKLLGTLLASAFTTEKLKPEEIENLKSKSELDGMMNELASYLPEVKEKLIDERDKYLASKIWSNTIEHSSKKEGLFRTTAVVGAGHLPGIKACLEEIAAGKKDADVSSLNAIPAQGFISKAAGWIIPLIIVALIIIGFFKAGAGFSFSMLLRWVLWNGSLAALGTILALGHPLSVLVAFVSAPVATMNPFIGVGLFSGITQVSMKKPRVFDAQNITEDVGSFKGFYRNRITRALLVFILSQIGGVIGNFISIPSMAAGLLGK